MAAQDQNKDHSTDTDISANDAGSDQNQSQPNPDISTPPITPKTINEDLSDDNTPPTALTNTNSDDVSTPEPAKPSQDSHPSIDNDGSMSEEQTPTPPISTTPQASPPASDFSSETLPDTQQSFGDKIPPPVSPTVTEETDNVTQNPGESGQNTDEKIPTGKVSNPGGSGSKYNIVIGILLVFALAGLSFAGYQFYQNRFASDRSEQENEQQDETPTPTPEPQIELSNGNIVSTTADGQETIIVSKTSFDTTGITGFTNIKTSPDNDQICFHTAPPSPEFAIYLSNLSGQNVTEVARGRTDCHWLGDGQSIVYEDAPNEEGLVNIYIYDIQQAEETILTDSTVPEDSRIYNINSIDEDGSTILCSYQTTSGDAPVDCRIDTLTGEITIPSQQQ